MALVIDDRLKVWDEKDQPVVPSDSLVKPMGQVAPPEPSLHSSPAREEGEVPESELDPDTRRRLLILQHGQDIRDHTSTESPFPISQPMQVSAPHVPSRGAWFPVEVEIGDDIHLSSSFSSHRDLDSESDQSLLHADTPAGVLQEIALKCGTKVEFTLSLVTELQFSVEVSFILDRENLQ
ncbi:unnamed protein product [Lupinus luteus]|uniref:Uncharacterized protein n=1 Tax=Lupinus luteus TaxID=3873 RepID=A0AAV1WS86_LUPLU